MTDDGTGRRDYPYSFADAGGRKSSPVDRPVRRLSRPSLRGRVRRLVKGRRLAVVDTHFPWQLSGFRYHEALEFHRALPDTLFFARQVLRDPFPAPVEPLVSFPWRSADAGVTDVYLVFLNLVAAFVGLGTEAVAAGVAGVPTFSQGEVADAGHLRVHAQLFPGGGLLPSTPPEFLRAVAERCTTVFTNVAEVEHAVPGAVFVPILVGAQAYPFRRREPWEDLRLVFVGDDRPRKGLSTLLEAFDELGGGFKLDVVGPNERYLEGRGHPKIRAHGWLRPDELRELYWRADVFVSPSTSEDAGDEAPGMVDGFPPTAAAEAMASGCALVASNPRGEYRGLRPEQEYLEIPERDASALAAALVSLRANRDELCRLAVRGAARVRAFSTEVVVPQKLAAMRLVEQAPPSVAHWNGRGGSPTLSPKTLGEINALLRRLPLDAGGGASVTKAVVVGELILVHDVRTVAEVGVYRGRFLLPVALVLKSVGRGRALGIDPYSPGEAVQNDLAGFHGQADAIAQWTASLDWDTLYAETVRVIDELALRDYCVIDRRTSRDAARDIADRSLDLVHIDGNHDRNRVEEDFDLYLPKVRRGGLVVVDDASWPTVTDAVLARAHALESVCSLYQEGADDFAVFRVP